MTKMPHFVGFALEQKRRSVERGNVNARIDKESAERR